MKLNVKWKFLISLGLDCNFTREYYKYIPFTKKKKHGILVEISAALKKLYNDEWCLIVPQ